jgi:hypothetical protein
MNQNLRFNLREAPLRSEKKKRDYEYVQITADQVLGIIIIIDLGI